VKDVIISPQAERELIEIAEYLTLEAGERVADRVLSELYDSIMKAARSPRLGRLHPEWIDERHRFWSHPPYYIVYREDIRPIRIVRILHMARDIPAVLKTD